MNKKSLDVVVASLLQNKKEQHKMTTNPKGVVSEDCKMLEKKNEM